MKTRPSRLWTYENAVVAMLGVTLAVIFLERQSITFLMPFIVTDLGLTNTQVGALGSVVSLTWAVAGFFAGRAADRTGRRKTILVLCIACFGVFCLAAGLTSSFVALLAVRLGMGAAGGPVPTLSALLLFEASSEHRRGFNASIGTLVGGLVVGAMPVALVAIAERFGWRAAFYFAGVPPFLVALIVLKFLREGRAYAAPAAPAPVRAGTALSLGAVTRPWNVRVCMGVGTLLLAGGAISTVFLPLFLVEFRGFSPTRMSVLTSVIGIAAVTGAITLPMLSDRLGRKTVLFWFTLAGVCAPLACLYWTGSDFGFAALLFAGSLGLALPPLVIGTIPSESLPLHVRGTAIGVIMGLSELVGGFLSPIGAGWLADRTSLAMPMYLQIGALLGTAALAALVHETAPAVINRRLARAALKAAS